MSNPEPDDEKPLDPEQQKIVAKVRWLMLISGFATVLGIAVVIGVIGYRVFRTEGSAAPAEVTAMLPKGAKVIATAVADDRIAVTVEVGGTIEVRTFDLKTLQADRAPALCNRAVSPEAQPAGANRRLRDPRERVYLKKPRRQLPSSSGPGRRPLTAKTGVRVP